METSDAHGWADTQADYRSIVETPSTVRRRFRAEEFWLADLPPTMSCGRAQAQLVSQVALVATASQCDSVWAPETESACST